MEVNPKFGIELECIYDKTKVNLNVHKYHQTGVTGEMIPNWSITNDSSLHVEAGIPDNSKEDNCSTTEIVSDVACGIDEMMDFVDDFVKYISKNGKYELNEVICFNKSCGAHIHFSTYKGKESNMLFTHRYKELRNRTLERIQKEYPRCYKAIKDNYFREYSKAQDGTLIDKGLRGEINYTAIQKGVEWRAFNLIGVRSWNDMKGIIRIGLEEIQKILVDYYDTGYKEYFEDVLSPKELKDEEDNIKLLFNGDEVRDA
jgi:hypothetical protein